MPKIKLPPLNVSKSPKPSKSKSSKLESLPKPPLSELPELPEPSKSKSPKVEPSSNISESPFWSQFTVQQQQRIQRVLDISDDSLLGMWKLDMIRIILGLLPADEEMLIRAEVEAISDFKL